MKKVLLFAVSLATFMTMASFAYAGTITLPNPLCLGGPGSPGCVGSFAELADRIITFISAIIASLAVLMFIIAGITFVASAGNPARIEQAKKIAIYAVFGAAIALAAKGLIEVIKAVIGAPGNP